MELFPAIDLRNGKCVRLHQGDYGQETIYGDDPVAQALAFADAGAGWIHVVDLEQPAPACRRTAMSLPPLRRPCPSPCRPVVACATGMPRSRSLTLAWSGS